MREFSLAAVVATNLVIGVRYGYLIAKGRISPALAMWVFFTIATVGSLLTYLAEGEYTVLDNILNTADIALVGFVALWITLFGDRSSRFSRFDLRCLVAVLAIVAVWSVTQRHVIAHASIQAILVVAYFPVVKRMWTSQRNTESFFMWTGLLLAPAFSLFSSRGMLAAVYAARAIVCAGTLLALMLRLEWKARRAGRAGAAGPVQGLTG